jgi:hypothetical protein
VLHLVCPITDSVVVFDIFLLVLTPFQTKKNNYEAPTGASLEAAIPYLVVQLNSKAPIGASLCSPFLQQFQVALHFLVCTAKSYICI